MANFLRTVMKKALITGVTGQDGSYLAEFLLEKGYEVHGIKRRSSSFNTQRIDHLYQEKHRRNNRFFLHYGDITDSTSMLNIVQSTQPDEIYHLAAQSHVKVSFESPEYTANADALGTLRILEAIRLLNLTKKVRFYHASTSEMYGKVTEIPQTEATPFYPRSPYGVAKLYAHWITKNYREAYNIFAVNGICFNHESPRRGETFVTRKITRAAARIKYKLQNTVYLGNLNAQRDWGYAKDYVYAMWLMLQHSQPHDYVVATGKTYSVRQCAELAFHKAGYHIEWRGSGIQEKGYDKDSNQLLIAIDPAYFRPTEVELLIGNPKKITQTLGWKPTINFEQLIELMVAHDIKEAIKETKLLTQEIDYTMPIQLGPQQSLDIP